MTEPKDIKTKLDTLASDLADMAAQPGVLNFADKLDAFKALTAYHLGITKVGNKKNGEKEQLEKGETFDGFRQSVKESG